MTKKYEKDGFTIVINRVVDETPDLSYLQQDYNEIGDETEAAKYRTQDYDRLMALDRGEWYMMGITCSVRKQTSFNWADGGLEVGRASVWGIESDSSEEYLLSVEKDMEHEALEELKKLMSAISPHQEHGEKLARFATNTDWQELRNQKTFLAAHSGEDWAEGLLAFLDNFQDMAHELGYPVYGE